MDRYLKAAVERLRRARLSTKLGLVTFSVAMLPLLVVIAQNDQRLRNQLGESQAQSLQTAARAGADRVDELLNQHLAQVAGLAENPFLVGYVSDPTRRNPETVFPVRVALADLWRLSDDIEGVFVLTASGDVMVAVGTQPLRSFGGEDFFRSVLAGQRAMSDVDVDHTGRPGIYFAAPLRDSRQSVIGTIATRVNLTRLEQLFALDRERFGAGSDSVLVDRRGTRLAGGLSLLGAELARATGTGQPVNRGFRYSDGDAGFTGASDPLEAKSWQYAIAQADTAALGGLGEITQTSLLIALATAIGILIVSYGAARLISSRVRDLQRVSSAIRFGDYTARAEVVQGDELGQVAATLNQMLDEVTVLIQTREERDRIQRQIMQLLAQVSSAAEGDLTIEAQVTEGELGSVADAFNYMIGELRTIIVNVNETTVNVSSSTGQILEASNALVVSAGDQERQIATVSREVEELSSSINRVSESARLSASVASEALQNAQQGMDSVRATIGGMQRIRVQVQQTAKQIKRLGESSQEIGQIVQVIEEMADQTNLLALNAAIQAAMAGDHGHGFAVVAEEVRRLAERASVATRQISTLVRAIQAETAQAVIAMEENTKEVVEGSRLADAAGRSLEMIDEVSHRLADLSETISQAADQQAGVSSSIAQSMQEISDVTKTTSVGTKQTAESVNYLARLSEQLRASVSAFRLQKSEA